MDPEPSHFGHLAATSRRLARRLLTIGENRLELLLVEAQEERARLARAILLALGVAGFGLLAGAALTGAVVVLFWEVSPLAVFLALAVLYGGAAGCLYRRLALLFRSWQSLPATIDQLRKDIACLGKNLT